MALEFGQIEPAQLGQASRFDIPFNEWVGVQFEGGLSSRLGPRLSSFAGEAFDNSPTLSPDDANQQFGIPGHLQFQSEVKAERAREMNERKQAELKYAAYHESAIHSWFSPKAAVGELAALVGGSLHPVDLAVNFLPFVGEEAQATKLATAGAGAVRQSFARGIITKETIEGLPLLSRFPNYSRHIIDATIGNAAIEIPNFYLARRNQEQYDEGDLAFNVLGGGIAGGTLAHGVKSLFKWAHFGYERLHGETRDAMNRDSMGGTLAGEERPLEQRAAVDEQAIRDAYKFDDTAERAKIIEELKSKPVRTTLDDLDAIETAAFGQQPKPPLNDEAVAFLKSAESGTPAFVTKNLERIASDNGVDPTGKSPNEIVDALRSKASKPADIQPEMARRVEAILNERRAESQRMVEGKISEAKAQALEQNIARAKTMSDEQVKQFAAHMEPGEKAAFLEADTAAKTEVANEMIKNLDDYATRLEAEAKSLEATGKQIESDAKKKSAELLREELKQFALGPKLDERLATAHSMTPEEFAKAQKSVDVPKALPDETVASYLKKLRESMAGNEKAQKYFGMIEHLIKRGDIKDVWVAHLETLAHRATLERHGGLYEPRSRTIFLALNAATTPEAFARMLTHESVHAALFRKLESLKTGEAAHAADHATYKRLTELFEEAKAAAGDKKFYGLTNVHEFVSEALSRPKFQQFLHSIKREGQSVWNRLIGAVADFFGLSDDKSLLTDVLTSTDELLSSKVELKPQMLTMASEHTPLEKVQRSFVTTLAEEHQRLSGEPVSKEVKDQQAQLKAEAEAKLKAVEAMREELKDQTDSVKTIPDEAIDAAKPCITGL